MGTRQTICLGAYLAMTETLREHMVSGIGLPCRSYLYCALTIAGALLFSACAGTKKLETTAVNFRCDSEFNEGLILPVDLVFISEGETVDAITGVSPNDWFDSEIREKWSHKQSMSLKSSRTRKTVKVTLKKPKDTVALVIIANYRNIDSESSELIILDAKDAEEREDVFITLNGLLH